ASSWLVERPVTDQPDALLGRLFISGANQGSRKSFLDYQWTYARPETLSYRSVRHGAEPLYSGNTVGTPWHRRHLQFAGSSSRAGFQAALIAVSHQGSSVLLTTAHT